MFKFKYYFSVILCLSSVKCCRPFYFLGFFSLASKSRCYFLTPPSSRVSPSQSRLDCVPQGLQCQGSIVSALLFVIYILSLFLCLYHGLCVQQIAVCPDARELSAWPGNLCHCSSYLDKYFFSDGIKICLLTDSSFFLYGNIKQISPLTSREELLKYIF